MKLQKSNSETSLLVVRTLVAVALAIATAGCAAGPTRVASAPTPRAARPPRVAFVEPPQLTSVHGVAHVVLAAVLSPSNLLPTFAFAGRDGAAPTIRVRQGDTIVVDYENDLPPDPAGGNATNLHFHGLVTSPHAPGDDVVDTMAAPGGRLHYVVKIGKTQEPGLYWYHPHMHGEANHQAGLGGMSGAIVVEGLERLRPRLRAMPERLLVVRDTPGSLAHNEQIEHPFAVPADREGGGTNAPCAPVYGRRLTVGDVVDPELPVRDGAPQFVRLLNATGSRTLDVAIPGATTTLVALDGVALDAYPGAPRDEPFTHLVVPPASRAEFVVAGLRPGMRLTTACYDSGPDGDADPATDLATFVAGTDAQPVTTAGVALPVAAVGLGLDRRPPPSPAARRTIVLSETTRNGATHFAIDGAEFAPHDAPLFTARVGTVEEWTVENRSREMHDFHVHQVHFAVERVDGDAPPGPRLWRDTFPVPAARTNANGSTSPSRTTILVDFRDPVVRGVFMLHCHLLDHEDAGMMATIRVDRP